jgi:hypothetical protein
VRDEALRGRMIVNRPSSRVRAPPLSSGAPARPSMDVSSSMRALRMPARDEPVSRPRMTLRRPYGALSVALRVRVHRALSRAASLAFSPLPAPRSAGSLPGPILRAGTTMVLRAA